MADEKKIYVYIFYCRFNVFQRSQSKQPDACLKVQSSV